MVFLGASITYGAVRDGKTLQTLVNERLGATVDIKSEAVSGWSSTRLAANIQSFVNRYPIGTYFVIHIGGNDVSSRRPYPGGAQKLETNLRKILRVIEQRGSHPILMRLSYRAYPNSMEAQGSLPYDENIYDPLCKEFSPEWFDSARKRCKLDFYQWSRVHKGYLARDGIHFTSKGYQAIREDFLVPELFYVLLKKLSQPASNQENQAMESPGFDGVETIQGSENPAPKDTTKKNYFEKYFKEFQ